MSEEDVMLLCPVVQVSREELKKLYPTYEDIRGAYALDVIHLNNEIEQLKAKLKTQALVIEKLEGAVVAGEHYLKFHSQGKGLQEFSMMNEDASRLSKTLAEIAELKKGL